MDIFFKPNQFKQISKQLNNKRLKSKQLKFTIIPGDHNREKIQGSQKCTCDVGAAKQKQMSLQKNSHNS